MHRFGYTIGLVIALSPHGLVSLVHQNRGLIQRHSIRANDDEKVKHVEISYRKVVSIILTVTVEILLKRMSLVYALY